MTDTWDGGNREQLAIGACCRAMWGRRQRVFLVDSFPSKKPSDPIVLLRRDEIVYSERIRNDVRTRNLVRDFHKLIEEILEEVTPDKLMQIKQRPHYTQLMGDIAPIAISRIVREVVEDEPLSKDYDFSAMSIEQHKRSGYNMAQQALSRSPR